MIQDHGVGHAEPVERPCVPAGDPLTYRHCRSSREDLRIAGPQVPRSSAVIHRLANEPADPGQVCRMTSQQHAAPAATRVPGRPAPRRSGVVLAVGLTLLAAAGGFAVVMRASRARPPFMGSDQAWLSLMRGIRSTPVTGSFKVLSIIGGPTGATIVVGVLCAGLLLITRWRTAIYLGLAEALGSSCSQLIKHLVMRH